MSRKRGPVETLEYGGMVSRMIRSWIKRVGHADEPELAQMLAARDELDTAILETVYMWRTQYSRSWAYIATSTGRTREAAFKRWDGDVKRLADYRNERHLLPAKTRSTELEKSNV